MAVALGVLAHGCVSLCLQIMLCVFGMPWAKDGRAKGKIGQALWGLLELVL